MKREFVINRHGKDYVLYAGLLDQAHQEGLTSIKTQLVQAPLAQNGHVAICLAEVTTEKGTFTGIGDADPENVSRAMANALIRLAETRAKARALRDAINVSMVAVEELSESAPESLAVDSTEVARRVASTAAAPGARTAGSAGESGTIVSLNESRPRRIRENGADDRAAKPADGVPATPTQIETIAKLARSVGRVVETDNISRAAASELITRLSEERYGARRSP